MILKQTVRKLKKQYALFWLLPVLLAAAFEVGLLSEGLCTGNPQMMYAWETAGILIALVCVPLSLKLFGLALKKKIGRSRTAETLSRYVFLSGVRLGILEAAVLPNILVYYLTLSNIGIFCSLISLTASVFCLPSEKRMCEELNLTNED
ncbi:MAG: hypothetical protein LBU44_08240 [Mediterranea sp.]|jgi:hypothetical protein|nr:hypothetical protein [Mediterranea sp.]